jgi:hypothetical protein
MMALTDTLEITQLSGRTRVRRLFEALSDDLDEFSLPDLADRVFEQVRADPGLIEQLIDEMLRPMVYEIGLGVLSSQRARRSRAAPVRDALLSLAEPPAEGGAVRSDPELTPVRRGPQGLGFAWLRQPVALAPRQTIRLRRAVRADLERAIHFGGQGIASTRVSLAYYELVKDGLTSETQTVAERYTDEELARLWQRAERRVATEDRVMAEVKQKMQAQRELAAARGGPAR